MEMNDQPETFEERHYRKSYATIKTYWTLKVLKIPFVIWLIVIGLALGVIADKLG